MVMAEVVERAMEDIYIFSKTILYLCCPSCIYVVS